jgi:hypothetical protein
MIYKYRRWQQSAPQLSVCHIANFGKITEFVGAKQSESFTESNPSLSQFRLKRPSDIKKTKLNQIHSRIRLTQDSMKYDIAL